MYARLTAAEEKVKDLEVKLTRITAERKRFEERATEEKKTRVEAERELRDAKEKLNELQGNLEVKVEYELRKHKAVLHEEQLRKDESRKEMDQRKREIDARAQAREIEALQERLADEQSAIHEEKWKIIFDGRLQDMVDKNNRLIDRNSNLEAELARTKLEVKELRRLQHDYMFKNVALTEEKHAQQEQLQKGAFIGRRYRKLLLFMTTKKYIKEYQWRERLEILHKGLAAIVFELIKDEELRGDLLSLGDVADWHQRTLGLARAIELDKLVAARRERQAQSGASSSSPSPPPGTVPSTAGGAASSPNGDQPTAVPTVPIDPLEREIKRHIEAEAARKRRKPRQQVDTFLAHIAEAEHILFACIMQVVEYSSQCRKQAQSFLRRNSELTAHCLDTEHAMAQVEQRCQELRTELVKTKDDLVKAKVARQRADAALIEQTQGATLLGHARTQSTMVITPAAAAVLASIAAGTNADTSTSTAGAATSSTTLSNGEVSPTRRHARSVSSFSVLRPEGSPSPTRRGAPSPRFPPSPNGTGLTGTTDSLPSSSSTSPSLSVSFASSSSPPLSPQQSTSASVSATAPSSFATSSTLSPDLTIQLPSSASSSSSSSGSSADSSSASTSTATSTTSQSSSTTVPRPILKRPAGGVGVDASLHAPVSSSSHSVSSSSVPHSARTHREHIRDLKKRPAWRTTGKVQPRLGSGNNDDNANSLASATTLSAFLSSSSSTTKHKDSHIPYADTNTNISNSIHDEKEEVKDGSSSNGGRRARRIRPMTATTIRVTPPTQDAPSSSSASNDRPSTADGRRRSTSPSRHGSSSTVSSTVAAYMHDEWADDPLVAKFLAAAREHDQHVRDQHQHIQQHGANGSTNGMTPVTWPRHTPPPIPIGSPIRGFHQSSIISLSPYKHPPFAHPSVTPSSSNNNSNNGGGSSLSSASSSPAQSPLQGPVRPRRFSSRAKTAANAAPAAPSQRAIRKEAVQRLLRYSHRYLAETARATQQQQHHQYAAYSNHNNNNGGSGNSSPPLDHSGNNGSWGGHSRMNSVDTNNHGRSSTPTPSTIPPITSASTSPSPTPPTNAIGNNNDIYVEPYWDPLPAMASTRPLTSSSLSSASTTTTDAGHQHQQRDSNQILSPAAAARAIQRAELAEEMAIHARLNEMAQRHHSNLNQAHVNNVRSVVPAQPALPTPPNHPLHHANDTGSNTHAHARHRPQSAAVRR